MQNVWDSKNAILEFLAIIFKIWLIFTQTLHEQFKKIQKKFWWYSLFFEKKTGSLRKLTKGDKSYISINATIMLYLNRFELFTMYLCDNWPHVKNNFSLELQGNIFWSLTFCIEVVFYKTGCCQGESFFKLSKVLHRVFYNTSKALLFSNREIESSCKNKHTYV